MTGAGVAGRLRILIPAYNEEWNIGELLGRLRQWGGGGGGGDGYEVVVVDDGSRDGTARVVAAQAGAMPVKLVQHPANRGVAAAFRTGFRAVLEGAGADDIVVTMEADNTSDLAILTRMVDGVRAGADLVLASCYAPRGGVEGSNLYRMALSKGANLLVRVLFGLPGVHTYSSFYRAYRAGALRRALDRYGEHFIESDGFECMVEVLVKLARLGLHIEEVPMTLRLDRRRGQSKMRAGRTIRGYLRLLLRESAGRWHRPAPDAPSTGLAPASAPGAAPPGGRPLGNDMP